LNRHHHLEVLVLLLAAIAPSCAESGTNFTDMPIRLTQVTPTDGVTFLSPCASIGGCPVAGELG
jgi:hypothetical protein